VGDLGKRQFLQLLHDVGRAQIRVGFEGQHRLVALHPNSTHLNQPSIPHISLNIYQSRFSRIAAPVDSGRNHCMSYVVWAIRISAFQTCLSYVYLKIKLTISHSWFKFWVDIKQDQLGSTIGTDVE
jgi:hypothetical protein